MSADGTAILRDLIGSVPRRYLRLCRRGRVWVKSPHSDPHRWAVEAATALGRQQAASISNGQGPEA